MVRTPRPGEPLITENLLENKFDLSIARLSTVSYKLTTAAIPGISVTNLQQPTPFRQHQLPGYKILYDQSFDVTFLVDEGLTNWQAVHDWMISISPPDSFPEYQISEVMSDARLLIYTAQNTISYEFVIEDMFPNRLSGLQFHYNAAEPLTASATFSYSKFRLDNVLPIT